MKYLISPLLQAVVGAGLLLAAGNPANAQDKAKKTSAKEKSSQPREEKKLPQLFDGKTLKGWRIIAKNDFEKHGKVLVKNGEIILEKGAPATGIAWKGDFPRTNYEVTLEARRVEGSDFFCGMTFPVGEEYCTLILGGWGGGVTGLSNIDGMAAVENETTGFIEFKQTWHSVRLVVTDKEISAWVGKEQIVDVQREGRKFSIWWEQEPVRPFGIATWSTKGALRKIQLKAVPQNGK